MKRKILLGVLLIAFNAIIECTAKPELTSQILCLEFIYVVMVSLLVFSIFADQVYEYKLHGKTGEAPISISRVLSAIQMILILGLILAVRLATVWLVCDI